MSFCLLERREKMPENSENGGDIQANIRFSCAKKCALWQTKPRYTPKHIDNTQPLAYKKSHLRLKNGKIFQVGKKSLNLAQTTSPQNFSLKTRFLGLFGYFPL